MHPVLRESFSVEEGELTVLRDGQKSVLRGMPNPLQLALTMTEFSDVIVLRRPPVMVQRLLFGALAPIARRRGYRASYPSLSG